LLSGRRKLLLADDSPTIQKVISLTFGDEGVEVVAVGDGESALRALEEEPPPDVLLADVVMPGPDGYELCERVKRDARLRHVPVVLLVGTFEPFNEAEARRVGADIVLTKPFQSIRGLVSKVGSLFGGGEPQQEDEAAHARDERTPPGTPPAEQHAAAARADTRAPEEARGDDAAGGAYADGRDAEPADDSFADFGADDELIEARPADAFGSAAGAAGLAPRAESARVFAETREPDFQAASSPEAGGGVAHAHAAFGAAGADAEPFARRDEAVEMDLLEDGLTGQAVDGRMHETTSSQSSFDTRATGAAAADDVLLDLGQVDTRATAGAAEADDFILDLDLDLDLEDEPRPQYADAPSAFAEAAHGERPRHFAEAGVAEAPAHFGESSGDGQTRGAQFLSLDEEPRHVEEAQAPADLWRDVVVQDGPQGFAFGAEARATGAAPRGFIEPEVVPADGPVPAVVEGEFTDGSVEGDTPKAPTHETTGAAAAVMPQEHPAAGHVVGEAHAGLEESPRAGQLSPEDVDAIARRVVELMSDKAVREIAWEVVPELAELVIRQRLSEENQG
jgi:CheY-like chemotaxis protein